MSLAEIKSAQETLEESFSKRMSELEAQLNTSGAAKDTVAKVAEEFRTFRELMFSMLGLLRKQIYDCAQALDTIETRHRRKALVFLGVPEAEKEDCRKAVTDIAQRMEIRIQADSFSVCHRLGVPNKEHHRPIIVWFSGTDLRSAVWRAKTKLRGSSVSVKEFLTKSRQAIFNKARQHFGLRSCWTQDGVIVVKTPDGSRHKIITVEGLNSLTAKHPKVDAAPTASKAVVGAVRVDTSCANNSKQRK